MKTQKYLVLLVRDSLSYHGLSPRRVNSAMHALCMPACLGGKATTCHVEPLLFPLKKRLEGAFFFLEFFFFWDTRRQIVSSSISAKPGTKKTGIKHLAVLY